MARPIKTGLDYFPHNTNLSGDDKFRIIEALHGLVGYAVILKIWELVYQTKSGVLEFGDEEFNLYSKLWVISRDNLVAIVDDAIRYHLFDSELYAAEKKLTSLGILRRYTHIEKLRLKWSEKRLKKLNNLEVISGDNSQETDVVSTQSKVKKSKVKKSKVDNISQSEEQRHRRGQDPKCQFFLATDSEWEAKIKERGQAWVDYWVKAFNAWASKNIPAAAKLPSHFIQVEQWEQSRIEEGKEWCENYLTGPGYYPSKLVQEFQVKQFEGAL